MKKLFVCIIMLLCLTACTSAVDVSDISSTSTPVKQTPVPEAASIEVPAVPIFKNAIDVNIINHYSVSDFNDYSKITDEVENITSADGKFTVYQYDLQRDWDAALVVHDNIKNEFFTVAKAFYQGVPIERRYNITNNNILITTTMGCVVAYDLEKREFIVPIPQFSQDTYEYDGIEILEYIQTKDIIAIQYVEDSWHYKSDNQPFTTNIKIILYDHDFNALQAITTEYTAFFYKNFHLGLNWEIAADGNSINVYDNYTKELSTKQILSITKDGIFAI